MSGITFCPVCEQPLNMGIERCPYCGTQLQTGDTTKNVSSGGGDLPGIRYTSASRAPAPPVSRHERRAGGRKPRKGAKITILVIVIVILVAISVFQPVLINSATSSFFSILSKIPGFRSGVEYPRILLSDTDPDFVSLSNDFQFQDDVVGISYNIDRNLYTAASNTGKSVTLYDNVSKTEWEKGLYQVMIADPGLDLFYESVLRELRDYGKIRNLDRDEYLELVTSFVQSIPYSTDNINTEPKYPVETVFGNRGDCDDKSLLLAGLLSREGYDVVLFLFEPEEHMSVGVRSDECSYRGAGYAFIETTNYAMVGWEDIRFEGMQELYSTPLVIPVGNGSFSYTACDQVSYIHSVYISSISNLDSQKDEIVLLDSKVSEELSELNNLLERMNRLKKSGNYAEYNSLVSQYNSMVDQYNADGKRLAKLVEEYNRDADLINEINERQYDRPGLYLLSVSV